MTAARKGYGHTLTHISRVLDSHSMARKTVYIPDELLARLESSETDIAQSLSREFQEYLRNRLAGAERRPWEVEAWSGATIRLLAETDIEAVLEMWDDVEDGWHLTEMARRRVSANLRKTIDHPEAFCLVAVRANTTVGFIDCSIRSHPVAPGTSGEIEELHVHRDHRRTGVGSDLVRSAIEWFNSMNISHVRLVYNKEDASVLKPFYERFGFDCSHTIANIWPQWARFRFASQEHSLSAPPELLCRPP